MPPADSLNAKLLAAQRAVKGRPADEALLRYWLCASIARRLVADGEIAEAQKYGAPLRRIIAELLPPSGLPSTAAARIALSGHDLIAKLSATGVAGAPIATAAPAAAKAAKNRKAVP